MAFDLNYFNTVSAGQNKNANTIWSYLSSSDTMATIMGSNYFSSISNRLKVGDLIQAKGSDRMELLEVTAVSPNVTTAVYYGGDTPAYIVKFAGKRSFGGGGTSDVQTLTGVVASDVVIATIQSATNAATVRAVPTTDTITYTYSADPGASTVVSYAVLRAAV